MDVYMCTILPWPGSYAPEYFQYCMGQQLAINQYQAMYALLGVTYGGNGTSNFALPDLRKAVIMGGDLKSAGYLRGDTGGAATGNGTVTVAGALALANLPQHTHAATFAAGAASLPVSGSVTIQAATTQATTNMNVPSTATGVKNWLGGLDGPTVHGPYVSALSSQAAAISGASLSNATADGSKVTGTVTVAQTPATAPTAFAAAGTATGVPTIPPYLALNFIIAVQGIFPTNPN